MKSVDQEDETGIVQSATRKVELLELAGRAATGQDVGEVSHHFVTKEVLVADQVLDLCIRQNLAKCLEAWRTDLILGTVQVFETWSILQGLREYDHAIVANHVALNVEIFKRLVLSDSLGDPFGALDGQLVEL